MSQDLLVKTGLYTGQEISKEEKKQLEDSVISDSALSYALNRLGQVMTSEKKLRDKLKEKGYGEDVIDHVIAKCHEFCLLNDEAMAHSVCENALSGNRGRGWTERKLRDRGLSTTVLDQYYDPEDEEQQVREALTAMIGEQELDRRQQAKMVSKLVRRGFSPAPSRSVVEACALSEEDEALAHGPEEAVALLKIKYPQGLAKAADRQKAYALLARRGYLSAVISRALTIAQQDT